MAAGELWIAVGTNNLRYRDASNIIRTLAERTAGVPTHGSIASGEIKVYDGHLVYIGAGDRQRHWTDSTPVYDPGHSNGEIWVEGSYLYVGRGTNYKYRQYLA